MLPGFSTNSFADTDPLAVLPVLAELGCRSLAITPDRQLLNPFADGLAAECERWRQELDRLGLACVIETGARHLLDPLQKHEPTLVSSAAADRDRRRDFLCRAIDLAAELQAGCG
jgi:L-ribulose-5-phosphate 3-epimerase